MKNLQQALFLLLICTLGVNLNAQQYHGLSHDNHLGSQSMSLNPAALATTPYEWDITIGSGSFIFDNDLFTINRNGFLGLGILNNEYGSFDQFQDQELVALFNNFSKTSGTVSALGEINLPSFAYSDGEMTLSFNMKYRTALNIDEVDSRLANIFFNDFDYSPYRDQGLFLDAFSADMAGWYEYGFGYARTVDMEGSNLNFGINFKLLHGTYAAYLGSSPSAVTLTDSGSSVNTQLYYGHSEGFEFDKGLYKYNSKGFGVGLDIGFEYTIPKDDGEGYKAKLGFAANDLGSISFDKDASSYDRQIFATNWDLTNVDVNTIAELDDTLNARFPNQLFTNSSEIKMNTPFHMNIYGDFNVCDNVYVSALAHISPKKFSDKNKLHTLNSYSATIRYETEKFTVGIPLSVNELEHFDMGLFFRYGPLFVGSNDFFVNLIDNEGTGINLYAGVKVPLRLNRTGGGGRGTSFRGNDIDGDGTPDAADECPDLAGPAENNGCPFSDKDNDGVLDHADKCIDVAGPAENNGCPYGDLDGDGILDIADDCIDVAGPTENNGCPYGDKDGDGVLDQADECIHVPGPVENNGCPILTNHELGIVKKAIDNLEFDFGKATIRSSSFNSLDALATLMKENPSWKIKISGHTDDVGTAEANLVLSRRRANAVKRYLADKGVKNSNIIVEYFGESKPISKNTDANGRQLNRRVEMKFIFK